MKKIILLFTIGAVLVRSGHPQQMQGHFDGKTWWHHVEVLANDKMEGRQIGSAGLRTAEAYVVEQLKKNGLQPAGVNGFYQPVKFESRRIVEKDSSLALVQDGVVHPLTLGDDAIFNTRIDLAPSVDAPLVFAGYGLVVPEMHYDDLTGLDLKDKVAVVLGGSPADIPGVLSSHYQSSAERWKVLQKAGAVGIIIIFNPAVMEVPWSRISANRLLPNMSLLGKEFDETAGEQLAVGFNPARAEELFAGSGHSLKEILEMGKERKQLPRFPLAVSIQARAKVEKNVLESANLIARLPGSDAHLKDECVVLSAHIDHLGIGKPVNGDGIYNGAMDNASGVAVLLDVAESLRKSPERLKRSLLFVFVTGEEQGLFGSEYFITHPTVREDSMVADINVDMFLPIVPLRFLTIQGLNESDLGESARGVAESIGVRAQLDPEPQRNLFVRSDQYSFIRHGIPGLAMEVSYEKGSPQEQTFKDWLIQRYHAPSDDVDQPVDLSAAAQYEEIIRALLVRVADDNQRPHWKQDSFFRRYAQPRAEN